MLFSVLKKLNFDGTLEIIDSNDKIYKFGNSNPHVCIRLKNKLIERKLFLNPNLHIGEAYMNKELGKAQPLAHLKIALKNIAHLLGIVSKEYT